MSVDIRPLKQFQRQGDELRPVGAVNLGDVSGGGSNNIVTLTRDDRLAEITRFGTYVMPDFGMLDNMMVGGMFTPCVFTVAPATDSNRVLQTARGADEGRDSMFRFLELDSGGAVSSVGAWTTIT